MHIFQHGRSRGGWSPLQLDADARFYEASTGVTSSGNKRVARFGVQCQERGIEEATNEPPPIPEFAALDGQGFVELPSGRFVLAGGAPLGYAHSVVNKMWYSDDRGKEWFELIADGGHPGWAEGTSGAGTHSTSDTRPEPMHTFGFFRARIDDVEYVYWMGGDAFFPSDKIFRIEAAELEDGGDPSVWELVYDDTDSPTHNRVLYLYGVLNGRIWVIGGQAHVQPGSTYAANKTSYYSDDGGFTWEAGPTVPSDVWGMQLGPLPVKDGKFWVIGSGRYDPDHNDLSNTVWTFDGDTTWTQVTMTGPDVLPKGRYHYVVVSDGRLWRFNGSVLREMAGAPDLTFDNTTKTITRSAGAWADEGFKNGQRLVIVGSTSNDGAYITSSTAGVDIVLDAGVTLVTDNVPNVGCTATAVEGDTATAYYSDDGASWHMVTLPAPDSVLPWGACHAGAAIATSDGIYITTGFEADNVYVLREHEGALVSEWASANPEIDMPLLAAEGEEPVYDLNAFGPGRPGVVFTREQLMSLLDVDVADELLEIWVVAKSLAFDENGDQPAINPNTVFVGNTDGSGQSNYGLNGATGELRYITYDGVDPPPPADPRPFGYNPVVPTANATGYNDDRPRLFGIQHQSDLVRFFVDGSQVGRDMVDDAPVYDGVGFTEYTGWNAVAAGWSELDKAEMVVGAVFIRTSGAPLTQPEIDRLAAWASRYGVTPA